MKDHGFCGHLLQRHKAVELEQERSERTIIGVSMSGLIEQEDQHWCLYERVDMMKMYSIVGYVMYEVSIV